MENNYFLKEKIAVGRVILFCTFVNNLIRGLKVGSWIFISFCILFFVMYFFGWSVERKFVYIEFCKGFWEFNGFLY